MDFSTISNKSTLENQTINALSHDELIESYSQLKYQFDMLTKSNDKLKQDFYDTKRSYDTALDLQEHLNTEVDTFQKNEVKLKLELNQKIQRLQDSIQSVTTERNDIVETYEAEVVNLKKLLKNVQSQDSNDVEIVSLQSRINRLNEDCKNLMDENYSMKTLIGDQEEQVRNSNNSNEMLQGRIASLISEIDYLKSTLVCKKEELNSASDLLNSAQEEVCLLKVELQSLKSDSSKHAAKGNSIFAEVEDKRQEMIQSLSQMRQKYDQLKIELANKQKEVVELLREKRTIWAELDGQASLQDAILIAGYEKRISDLERVCEQQRKEITRWYGKNLNPNSSDLEQWITGVLAHKSDQCLRLSDELAACSVDCLAKEKKIRQLHSQLSSYSFVTAAKDSASDQSHNGEITSVGSYRSIVNNLSTSSKANNITEDINKQSITTSK